MSVNTSETVSHYCFAMEVKQFQLFMLHLNFNITFLCVPAL